MVEVVSSELKVLVQTMPLEVCSSAIGHTVVYVVATSVTVTMVRVVGVVALASEEWLFVQLPYG